MTSVRPQIVFVVDDDASVHRSVMEFLEGLNVEVASFCRAEDCLEQLYAGSCNLLITDVKLPDMDGLEFLDRIKSLVPWLPILVVTGVADIPMTVKAMKSGISDFIEKPLERSSFAASAVPLLQKTRRMDGRFGQPLTKTERRVLACILAGMTSRDIAYQLFRSVRTVELHRQHIMRKTGVRNMVELIRLCHSPGT